MSVSYCCRDQEFDNGVNMIAVYTGVGARISSINPCAVHSLNVCGVNFFEIVLKHSKSPQRWEILKKELHCSLHKLMVREKEERRVWLNPPPPGLKSETYSPGCFPGHAIS